MDNFSETLVKRKLTEQDKKKVKLIFASLILSSIIFILVIPLYCINRIPLVSTLSLAIFALIVWLLWSQLKKMQLEYEYIITGTVLDVDKIIARKKRQRIVSLDLKEISDIGVYDKNSRADFESDIHAERDTSADGNYFIAFHHTALNNTRVVFTPDEKMFESLRNSVPRNFLRNLPKPE